MIIIEYLIASIGFLIAYVHCSQTSLDSTDFLLTATNTNIESLASFSFDEQQFGTFLLHLPSSIKSTYTPYLSEPTRITTLVNNSSIQNYQRIGSSKYSNLTISSAPTINGTATVKLSSSIPVTTYRTQDNVLVTSALSELKTKTSMAVGNIKHVSTFMRMFLLVLYVIL